MSSRRDKIWLKIAALTVAGVFLFSEATWAARLEITFAAPEVSATTPTKTHPFNLGDILWQIYQEITFFLIPVAHAEEISPYKNKDNQVLPALNPKSKWKKPGDAVKLIEEADEQKLAQDESGQTQVPGEDELKVSQNFTAQAGQNVIEPLQVKEGQDTQVSENETRANNNLAESESSTGWQAEPEQKVENTPSLPENKATNSGATIKLETTQPSQEGIAPREEAALEQTPRESSPEQAKRKEVKSETQIKALKEIAQTRESLAPSSESNEAEGEIEVNTQPIRDLKPTQVQEVAQKETKARVQASADLKPRQIQIQEVAQESAAVNKKGAGAKNPDNENIQKEDRETLISSHSTVQETKERIQINGSGRKFIIPPLENVVIPLVPRQATEQNNSPKPKGNTDTSSLAFLTNKDKAEGVNVNYRIEDAGKKIDDLYKSAPPTGPPKANNNHTLLTVTTSSQSTGNSQGFEPVEQKGLIVSHQQTGITLTEETALPNTAVCSTLHNHGPPL